MANDSFLSFMGSSGLPFEGGLGIVYDARFPAQLLFGPDSFL
jgi:hypothetical protein